MLYDHSVLTVESRPEPERSDIQIPLPTDDDWIYRVALGGGCYLTVSLKFRIPVIGFAPANGYAETQSAYYPVEDIYKAIRRSRPEGISPDVCFAAINLLKRTVDRDES